MNWSIFHDNALAGLVDVPSNSIHACVTSPPYWGLRDYGLEPIDWPAVEFGWPGGVVSVEPVSAVLGLEKSLEQYIGHLVLIFREVWRVMREDGTLWLNMGDGYVTRPRGNDKGWDKSRLTNPGRVQKAQVASLRKGREFGELKHKDLIGAPWLLALALRADGWWLRNDDIWSKPNPMPESVKDRCSRAHEYVFQLNKSKDYYFDIEAIREPATHGDNPRKQIAPVDRGQPDVSPHRGLRTAAGRSKEYGRQKRTVWNVATVPYPDAHFAAFPPKLIEPCILAATSPQCCAECAAPYVRILDRQKRGDWNPEGKTKPNDVHRSAQANGKDFYDEVRAPITLGWEPSCEHDAPGGAPTVLDPFTGSGVAGMVALANGRGFIGIEPNAEYVELARRRIIDSAPLINSASEVVAA